MSEPRTRGMNISTRVTLLTFVAVTAAVVLVSLISVWGVSHLTVSEGLARVAAYRAHMVDDLGARLDVVDRVVGSLAMDTTDRIAADGELALAHLTRAETGYFESLALLDAEGRTLSTRADPVGPLPAAVSSLLASAPAGKTSHAWVPDAGPDGGRLWIVRPLATEGGRLAIVARIQPSHIARAADGVAPARSSVSILIADGRGDVMHVGSGSAPFEASSVRYAPGTAAGRATAMSAQSGPMRGSWARVGASRGLDWRVVVLESEAGSMARVRDALTPAVFAMLIVLVVAVLTALVYSRRLVAPLRVFESSARDVAAGGYVRPLKVAREDELGRVADAFNDMGVRLNSMQDLAQLLASAANLDDVLDAVLNAIGHILGTGDAAVLLADQPAEALVLARGRGLAAPDATFVLPLDDESPITVAFHELRTTCFGGDGPEGLGAIYDLFKADPGRAGVAVPLTTGPDVLGVVVVLAPGHRPLTDSQIETLRIFSANAAVAVRISRLFEEEHLSRTEAEALRSVAELTAPASDLAHALDRAGAVAADLLGYSEYGVVLEKRENLGLGLPADEDADRLLTSVWRLVLAARPERDPRESTPILVHEGDEPRLAAMLGPAWGSALFVPLLQGKRARGALILHDSAERPRPTDRQLAVARTIGQEMSLAIRNVHLLQQARTRAANLETVFRISQAVSSELQITVVLNRVLDVVQKILSADAVALMSFDPERGTMETSMARGIATREMLYFSAAPGQDIPGQVFEQRTPLVYGALSHRPTPLAALASDQGFDSLLAVPLMARGRSIGVLTVFANQSDAFSSEDMELLSTFASQAAIALDTAALFGKEHHVASVLQASILPEVLPDVDGLESASFYLPSGTEAEIGGDYYDMFFTGDGRLVLAIGDVCGKGVVAATKTSMVRYALRGLMGAGLGPGAALQELNRQVAGSGDPSDIVTVWLGTLDLEEGTLLYANGGHPPGVLKHGGSKDVDSLGATGPLLGAVGHAVYQEFTVPFAEDDVLLLYTDGVTESRRDMKFFGEGRVRRVVRDCRSAQGCVDGLLAALEKFTQGPLRDDAAALAVRRIPRKSPAGRVQRRGQGYPHAG